MAEISALLISHLAGVEMVPNQMIAAKGCQEATLAPVTDEPSVNAHDRSSVLSIPCG
jgi:hypothetical protein